MPLYTAATAALAVEVQAKWLDNLLSHHIVPGVQQSKQGVARRLTPDAILTVALARILNETLAIPTGKAVDLANRTMAGQPLKLDSAGVVLLQVDVSGLQARLAERLRDAVEAAPRPRRGRPASS